MKLGIETAFNVANAKGGLYGRQLRLVAADDGYEPARAAVTIKQLYERDQVLDQGASSVRRPSHKNGYQNQTLNAVL